MSKGFVILAQNNSVEDYVRMAYGLSLSLKLSQPVYNSVSLITNDIVPENMRSVFDNIIPIEHDHASGSKWKIENRYKIYDLSPYDETIVLDSDMLVLTDISHYWDILDNYNIYFTSKVLTYRGEEVTKDDYRRVFSSNSLPNLYTGLHYFKKSKEAKEFYNWMETITTHWQDFYNRCLVKNCPANSSMDVTAALTAKILGCEDAVTNKLISFVHMKPALQDWRMVPDEWITAIGYYFNNRGQLKIGNFLQDGVFHYTEKRFLTDNILSKMEQLWNC